MLASISRVVCLTATATSDSIYAAYNSIYAVYIYIIYIYIYIYIYVYVYVLYIHIHIFKVFRSILAKLITNLKVANEGKDRDFIEILLNLLLIYYFGESMVYELVINYCHR